MTACDCHDKLASVMTASLIAEYTPRIDLIDVTKARILISGDGAIPLRLGITTTRSLWCASTPGSDGLVIHDAEVGTRETIALEFAPSVVGEVRAWFKCSGFDNQPCARRSRILYRVPEGFRCSKCARVVSEGQARHRNTRSDLFLGPMRRVEVARAALARTRPGRRQTRLLNIIETAEAKIARYWAGAQIDSARLRGRIARRFGSKVESANDGEVR